MDGISGRNMSHAWNLVKLDSGTYYLNITWSDGASRPGSPGWHDYFMLTQEQILLDHEITDGTVASGTASDFANRPQP